MPFPDMAIWPVDGASAFALRDLLQDGGVILLVTPNCGVCTDAAEQLDRLLRVGDSGRVSGTLLADQAQGASELRRVMGDHGITVPVYRDSVSPN
jgi:hypothetical protein